MDHWEDTKVAATMHRTVLAGTVAGKLALALALFGAVAAIHRVVLGRAAVGIHLVALFGAAAAIHWMALVVKAMHRVVLAVSFQRSFLRGVAVQTGCCKLDRKLVVEIAGWRGCCKQGRKIARKQVGEMVHRLVLAQRRSAL